VDQSITIWAKNCSTERMSGTATRPLSQMKGEVRTGKRPRRVLFVIDSFNGAVAGAEGVLVRIVRNLDPDRYQCSAVTFSARQDLERFQTVSCDLRIFRLRKTRPWTILRAALQLREIIRREQVSVVHTFFETSDLLGGMVAKLSGCPVLVSSRRDMGILRRRYRLGYRVMNRYFDQVQTVSEEVRRYCIEKDGVEQEKAVTVYNGVEFAQIAAAAGGSARVRASLGVEQASHLIVSVGNVRDIKGFDVLIQAAARVVKEFPKAVFLIIGDTLDVDRTAQSRAYFEALLQLRDSLNLTRNVIFTGQRQDVFSILNAADVFALLSRSEGLSNAVLEGMAAGLPVVATRVGGNPEIIEENRSGFLVGSDDAETAGARILQLLRCPALRKQMGDYGRQAVQGGFTVDAMVNRMMSLYDGLLGDQDPSAAAN